MIYLIKGRSGTGKTTYLHNLFGNLTESENRLLFIVPDNCTFETGNRFLDDLEISRASKIKVMGFKSMCEEIFEYTGNTSLRFADEGVRHVVMNLAIDSCKNELELFKTRVKSKDLCELMLSTLKDLKLRGITSDDLKIAAEKVDDEKLILKLRETARIFDAYDTYLSAGYIDPQDMLTKALLLLKKSRLYEGYTIAVDSHKAFNRQQYDFLKELMHQSKDIYFSILTDDIYIKPGELFYTNDQMAKTLLSIADSLDIKEGECDFVPNQKRFVYEDLKAVEDNIYRQNKTAYDGECDHIQLYTAQSIYDESDYVARTIKKLVCEDNYRYKDIAVISRHTENYRNILDIAFSKYKISYFISRPQSIDSKPAVRFIMSAFDIINDRYDKDDVLSLLKTGLTSFSNDDISLFENYIFTWDITGKAFFSEFRSNPEGFSDIFTDSENNILSIVENIRSTVIGALREFDSRTKNATGHDILSALVDLMYKLEVDKNTEKLAKSLDDDKIGGGEEIYRMYNLLMEIFDKMDAVTGKFKIGRKRFSELLYTHISNSDISYIPSGLDQVTLYDVTTLSINDNKAVFVIGCNDSQFPNTEYEHGLFSGDECSILQNFDLEVDDTVEMRSSAESMYVYAALTRPTEKLYITMYRQEIKGDVLEASSIFSELEKSVRNISILDHSEVDIRDLFWSDDSAFEFLAEKYTDGDYDLSSLEEYFKSKEKYAPVLSRIQNDLDNREKKIIDTSLAKELFTDDMRLSASQVDRYYQCRFEYFLQYGLGITERKKAVIDSLEYGTMMHYVLESYIRNHKSDDFSKIEKSSIGPEVTGILDSYARNHLGGLEDKSERFLYLFSRMKKTAVFLITHMVEELAQCEFRPVDFELGIGKDIPEYRLDTGDGNTLRLIGSVDRVDTYDHDGNRYIRIIDYKTGTKEFNLSYVLYGLDLQMLLYLTAIEVNGKDKYGDDITPGGILYAPAKDPLLNVSSTDDIEKEKNKELKMKGVILDNSDVIHAMEKEGKGVYIPVEYTKSGAPSKKSAINLASLEDFGLISKKINSLLVDMARALYSGKINDVPVKGKKDACRYCPYSCVCNHKDTDPFINVQKHSREEFYNKLREENADE